jgi:AraC family transcriptional regulator
MGAFCNLVTPHPTVERLARTCLLVDEVPFRERQLFLQGMALGLASVLRNRQRDTEDGRVRRREGLSDGEFRRCAEFAEAHVDRRVDIASWAAALMLSTNEFGRRFQRKTGVSPYHWLLDLRLERARMLLESSDLPLAEVALRLGFCSQSHFTDSFRRRHGLSPGRWRRQRRGDPDKLQKSGSGPSAVH